MDLAIVRPSSHKLNLTAYNVQEIGLAKALLPLGVSSDIFMAGSGRSVHTREISYGDARVKVYFLPTINLPGQQGVFPHLFSLMGRKKYDVIQVHDYIQVTSALTARHFSIRGIPVVLCQGIYSDYQGTFRNSLQRIYDRIFGGVLKRSVKKVICKTTDAQHYMEGKGFTNNTALPVGLDQSRFYDSRFFNWREILGISDEAKILLYVGKVVARGKNVDFILKVVKELACEIPGLFCLIVGKGPDLEYCKKIALQLGIMGQVRFLGQISQHRLSAVYRCADLLLLPSSYEIYGMVVLESMYFGLPVVSTETAGPRDLINHGLDGYLIGELDVSKWKQSILRLLKDEETRDKMSCRAQEKVQTHFLWEKIAPRYLKVYQELAFDRAGEFDENYYG